MRRSLRIFAVALSLGLMPLPASALTVLDPANLAQNIAQVAESVRAFAQRNQQLIQLLATADNTARSVESLKNGQNTAVFGALNALYQSNSQYAGILSNAESLILRSSQLLDLAGKIKTPQDAIEASTLAITLTRNVMNDTARLLSVLEPGALTQKKLLDAMHASATARGETQAIQAQTQLQAVRAQIQLQQYEIARLRLANELAREQRSHLRKQRSRYRLQRRDRPERDTFIDPKYIHPKWKGFLGSSLYGEKEKKEEK